MVRTTGMAILPLFDVHGIVFREKKKKNQVKKMKGKKTSFFSSWYVCVG